MTYEAQGTAYDSGAVGYERQGRATSWTPWGNLPAAANDNRVPPCVGHAAQPFMLGLTGKRNVGKSTVAKLLEEHGFERIHAFDGGKEAAQTYFAYVTGDVDRAHRMVYGDLKDLPCPDLPEGQSPRYFLERFGKFMGVDMGIEWTLGMEVARIRRISPRAPIVIESLVYEAPWFRAQGGVVVRLERPGHDGPVGVESDAVQAAVAADATISATSVDELEREAIKAVQQLMGGF